MPDGQPHIAGWPPPGTGYPPPGYPPPGTGWPPPGYPPPYAYPGHPQGPSKTTTSSGRIVGIVVAAVVALVLLVCGCLCVAGLWLDQTDPDPVAEEPWVVPDDDGWTEPTTGPIIPERPTAPQPPTTSPTPSKKPVTRPTSGPAPVTVVYQLSGSGVVDLAYFDAESDLIHVDGQKLPWSTTIRTNGKTRVMVEARWADDEGERPLDCTVTVTGAGKPVVKKIRGYWATSCTPE
ncbi:MmpS family transport accessory protein [Micromonospora sp. NPDC049089]|uniref:MmpS family transport accessory protein n=1 Tax=Micromonospora sp. NPDC049089 TaxID=3155496 RepID=UPI0033F6248E